MGRNTAIALGLALGLLLGIIAAWSGHPTLLGVAEGVAPIGRAFINLIQMVVVPLVATSVFGGVAAMGDLRVVGRNGGVAILFLWGTTLLAILTGMGVMTAALPLAGSSGSAVVGATIEAPALPGAVDFLLSLIPANAIRAAAEGALLPLMVFTVLFAAAAGTLPDERRRPLTDLVDSATQALIKLVHWVLWTAPVGVFALAAPVAANTGWGMLRSLGVFVAAVIVALALFVAIVYLPAVRLWSRTSVRDFLRANVVTAPIAFSTTSSAATIPAMFEATEQVLHVPRSTTSLIIPLAAAVNRSGSALFQGAALVFLAHLYGTPFGPSALLGAVFATFLVALTIAAVPSASVMTLPPAMGTLGIPLDGLAVLMGVDRIPDMFRTVVNVMGDLAAVAVVDGRRVPYDRSRGRDALSG